MRPALLWVLMTVLSAHASVYYVTVAGLGGEPDYEQRFTANAKDLDKLFKESGNSAHVYTLTGTQATKAHLTETLASIAHDAKPEDDFVLMLIGHGSSMAPTTSSTWSVRILRRGSWPTCAIVFPPGAS